MIIKEELMASDYVVYDISQSKIDFSKKVEKLIGYKCPNCKMINKLSYIETFKCKCGLMADFHGNLMIVEIEKNKIVIEEVK